MKSCFSSLAAVLLFQAIGLIPSEIDHPKSFFLSIGQGGTSQRFFKVIWRMRCDYEHGPLGYGYIFSQK